MKIAITDKSCVSLLNAMLLTQNHTALPHNPLAMDKLYTCWVTVNNHYVYSIYACNVILFNNESPVRGETFITRKITRALARIKFGLQDHFTWVTSMPNATRVTLVIMSKPGG
jgi:GDP-D-mannose dehydratase